MDTPVKLVAIGDPDGGGQRILGEYLEVGDRKLMLKLEGLARDGSPLIGYLPSYGFKSIFVIRDLGAFLTELREYRNSRWGAANLAFNEAIPHIKKCPELTWAFYVEE